MRISTTAFFLGAVAVSAAATAGDQRCDNSPVGNGVDFKLPCQWHSPLPASDSAIKFESGSAQLAPDAAEILDRQAAILRRYPGERIIVKGYMDAAEARSPGAGITLARKRAEEAREHLIRRGIAGSRVTAIGSDTPLLIPRKEDAETLARMRVVWTATE